MKNYKTKPPKKGVTTDGRLKPGYEVVNGKIAQVYDTKNSVARQDSDGVWRNHVGLMKLGFDEDTAYEFAGAATGGEQERMMKEYQAKKKGVKKAYNGIQSVEPIIEDVNGKKAAGKGALGGAATGAQIGMNFGPQGALIGAGIGALGGAINSYSAAKEQNRLNAEQRLVNKNTAFNTSVAGVEDTQYQKTQIMKKGGKAKTTKIEIEGDVAPEIHARKVNGKYKVISKGKKRHEEGGTVVTAKKGDTVFPTQNSVTDYKYVSSLIKEGKTKELDAIKKTLPEDGITANDGLKSIQPKGYMQQKPPTDWTVNKKLPKVNMGTHGYTTIADSIQAPDWMDVESLPKVNNVGNVKYNAFDDALQGLKNFNVNGVDLSNAGQYAGIAHNLLKGQEEPEKIERNYLNLDKVKYTDRANPNRKESRYAMTAAQNNARNLSGGNTGNYRVNAQQANLDNYRRQEGINNGEAAKADEVQRINTDLGNQERQANLGLRNQYNDIDSANEAATDAYTETALTDLGRVNQINKQMSNQIDYENKYLAILNGTKDKPGMFNYTIGPDGGTSWSGERTGSSLPPAKSVTETVTEKKGNTKYQRRTSTNIKNKYSRTV